MVDNHSGGKAQFGSNAWGCCLFLSTTRPTWGLWFSALNLIGSGPGQVWTRFTIQYCFRLYPVRFHFVLSFWFVFVNSMNVTPLDLSDSGSLLVCSGLHSWHNFNMFWLIITAGAQPQIIVNRTPLDMEEDFWGSHGNWSCSRNYP